MLDKVWDKVVAPIFKHLNAVCGLDQLKMEGWATLASITTAHSRAEEWQLDQLFCRPFLESLLLGRGGGEAGGAREGRTGGLWEDGG